MYRHEKSYTPDSMVRKQLSATQPFNFEIGVYSCSLNFNEISHLSFVVNLKFIKQFRTLYKKWSHIDGFHSDVI